jgi:hypothetical protein
MAALDWGKTAGPFLEMILRNALLVHGLDAQVYQPIDFPNGYDNMYPENALGPGLPWSSCKIFIGQPLEGLNISDYIRVLDTTVEMLIVTDFPLELEMQLRVTMPDNKQLNLRVIESLCYSQLSSINWKWKCVVT